VCPTWLCASARISLRLFTSVITRLGGCPLVECIQRYPRSRKYRFAHLTNWCSAFTGLRDDKMRVGIRPDLRKVEISAHCSGDSIAFTACAWVMQVGISLDESSSVTYVTKVQKIVLSPSKTYSLRSLGTFRTLESRNESPSSGIRRKRDWENTGAGGGIHVQ
jgi:hypothetical protein